MKEALKQERDSIKQNILSNPSIVTWATPEMIDNGYGQMIPDPSGSSVDHKERVRLSHEKSGVNTNEETPAGLGTSYSLFVLAAYNSKITKGITIMANGSKYNVGTVDTLRKFGGVTGYQAPLTLVS
jgi:hypothetical protein